MPDRLVAVNDADYRLPEPVRQSLATDLADSATELGASMFGTYADQQRMGIVLPAATSISSIQEACDSARTFGTKVWASGSITTNATLRIRSNFDFSGLTINYTGNGVGVILGDESGVTFRIAGTLPRVIASNKSGSGWSSTSGTTGVLAVNLNSCSEIIVPHIRNFETGLRVAGLGQGCAYNTFLIGHLQNNKVNLSLDADSVGWSNQNVYIGGRFSHESGEGTNTPGVVHLDLAVGLVHPPNNNLFLNPSLEGDTPEYHARIAGSVNVISNGRWEAANPKVRWMTGAVRNEIHWGYNSHLITETVDASAGNNFIIGQSSRMTASTSAGQFVLENSSSSGSPVLTVMAAGARQNGADFSSSWTSRFASNYLSGKRDVDPFARCSLDFQNGRIYLGNGAAAPTMYLDTIGTSGVRINGGNLVFGTDNAFDIGTTGANKPRYVRAATAVVTGAASSGSRPPAATAGVGAMFFDTTLNKPIWSTGSAWVDALGSSV